MAPYGRFWRNFCKRAEIPDYTDYETITPIPGGRDVVYQSPPEGNCEVSALPKLRIRLPAPSETRDICSLEQARYRFDWGRDPFLIVVEGQAVDSFENLMKLAGQDRFKDREFLEVEVQPLLAGG
jgi:hypothetical protein